MVVRFQSTVSGNTAPTGSGGGVAENRYFGSGGRGDLVVGGTVDTAIPNAPGGDGTDIGAVELPASSVVVPPSPSPTPSPTPGPAPRPVSGFAASIRGVTFARGHNLLLVGNSTPVSCSVRSGTLASCVIEVFAHGRLVASGAVTTTRPSKTLTTKVTPTAAGRRILAGQPLGINAGLRAVVSTSAAGSPVMGGTARLLTGPSITLPVGWRSSQLSGALRSELTQVARLIRGASRVTVSGYSDTGKGDLALTRAEARAAGKVLVRNGLKGRVRSIGRGHSTPIASNRTRRGRAGHNRLVITFRF